MRLKNYVIDLSLTLRDRSIETLELAFKKLPDYFLAD